MNVFDERKKRGIFIIIDTIRKRDKEDFPEVDIIYITCTAESAFFEAKLVASFQSASRAENSVDEGRHTDRELQDIVQLQRFVEQDARFDLREHDLHGDLLLPRRFEERRISDRKRECQGRCIR